MIEETLYHVINECSKLAQKEYKNRHDWVGKVTHWELCKRLKFYHTDKCYMYKLGYRDGIWHGKLSHDDNK